MDGGAEMAAESLVLIDQFWICSRYIQQRAPSSISRAQKHELPGHDRIGCVDFVACLPGMRPKLLARLQVDAVDGFLAENRRASPAAKRMEYRGYGSTKPIASNDNPEGRQLNRRTEFKITGTDYKPLKSFANKFNFIDKLKALRNESSDRN